MRFCFFNFCFCFCGLWLRLLNAYCNEYLCTVCFFVLFIIKYYLLVIFGVGNYFKYGLVLVLFCFFVILVFGFCVCLNQLRWYNIFKWDLRMFVAVSC